jgi:type I restriction enzyme S subunit
MKRYDSYKDSEIQWSPRVPNHWKVERIKNVFTEKRSTPNSTLNSGSISFGEVIYKDDESIPVSTKESYQELLEGEFIVNPLNLNYDLKSLRIGLSRINVVVSQGYIILLNTSENNSEFLRFLLREFDVRHIKSLGNGVRQTISFKHLSNELIPVPPLSEQQQIVSFLDIKTSQIDELIQKKERKIELLKEYRTSLINQVVTKGLNPNVEMKDSGVEWIGEIPSSWEISLVKFNFTILGGSTPSTEVLEYWGGSIPWISSKDVKTKYLYDSQDYVTDLGVQNSSCQIVPINSLIVVVRSGILQRTIPVSINKVELVVNQDQKVLIPMGNINPHWFYYFIKGSENWLLQDWVKDGTTVESIELRYLENQKFGLPSINEQQQIVEYLDEQTSKIDSSIQTEERKIELLKEYRQSLISSVVTGKIDVRTN